MDIGKRLSLFPPLDRTHRRPSLPGGGNRLRNALVLKFFKIDYDITAPDGIKWTPVNHPPGVIYCVLLGTVRLGFFTFTYTSTVVGE